MNKAITHLLALTALASSQVVMADATAISCHGCSDSAKSQAASKAASEGIVHVFDQKGATVSSYSLYTEILDIRPWTRWTTASLIPTDPTLKKSYRQFARAQSELEEMGTIYLPGDFEFGTVAGAILDPRGSTTAIEDYLSELNRLAALNQATMNLVSRITQLDLGVIDLGDIVKDLVIKVEFPDGSEMSYILEFSLNPGNNDLRIELVPFGNARGPDGKALPTHGNSLRGRTFTDHNGSMIDWINYVRSLGIPVVSGGGSGDETIMECKVSGSNIVCTVRRQNR